MNKLISLSIAVLSLIACSTLSVRSDYDRAANFNVYHTYAWLGDGALPAQRMHGVRNPLNARRIRDAIDAQLVAKGYVAVPNPHSADFLVNYSVGIRDRTDIDLYPAEYRGPWRWGDSYFGSNINVRTYREGTLSIDIFDVRLHQPVWHGWATKQITNSHIEQPEPIIQEAVVKILAAFPPR